MLPPNAGLARDYDDAIGVARRAKNWLFLLLLVMLLAQIAVFFTARQTAYVLPDPVDSKSLAQADGLPVVTVMAASTETPVLPGSATQPADAAAKEKARANLIREGLWYLTAGINFLGIILAIVLLVTLLMIVNVMLVRRHVGVARVTSAFVWCLLLVLMLFPWQSFITATFSNDFKIPGVLYTWPELTHPTLGAKFGKVSDLPLDQTILRWARFVVWPGVAVLLLLIVQAKSSRGVRAALGETELEAAGDIVS